MFKKAGLMVLASVLFLASFTLSGCIWRSNKLYEDGFFQYVLEAQRTSFLHIKVDEIAAIVGFTESGQQQEVIDIPRTIDGKSVRYIGYRVSNSYGAGYYHLESPKLKKIYIHDNITSVRGAAFSNWEEAGLDIMICAARNYSNDDAPLTRSSRTFIYRDIYDNLDEKPMRIEDRGVYTFSKSDVHPANITFLYNHPDATNDGYYRLDNIESGEKIPKPPNPERAGYRFTGWYVEPNCATPWSFDNAKEIAQDEEFRLYAGWQ